MVGSYVEVRSSMDDYDYSGEYDNFDTGDFDSLGNTGDYSGFSDNPDFSNPFGNQQSNNNGGFDFQSEYDNFGQQPQYSDMFQGMNNFGQGLQPTQSLNSVGEFGQQGNLSSGIPENSGGISAALANIFNGMGSQGSQGSKGMLSGLGALVEGRQNRKKASSIQNIVNQQQARMDPFGSQRPMYQQELARTMQDPYSAPIVRNQVQQMQQAQAIKDAAAGRRSNQATSNPALMAAQAQVAQKYMDSLYTPSGANIAPNASGLAELMQGNNAAINGYASPIMSALGYNSGSNNNQDQMQQIVDALARFKAGQ